MRSFPKQRLPYSHKIAKDYKWAKDVMNSLLRNFTFDSTIVNAYRTDYHRKLSNYQLYNNILNQKDFERECNPLGLEVGQIADEIQPYNKTYNKIQVLLGEALRRPFNFRTILVNANGIRSKLAQRDALLRKFVEDQIQRTIASLSDIYPQDRLQEETEKVMDPKEVERFMKTSYLDAREQLAAKILRYLLRSLDIDDKRLDAFKHGLISGEEIVYVGTFNDEPVLDVVNTLGFFCHKSPETKWVQDALYAGTRTYMSPAEVLDNYGPYLSEEDRKKIDEIQSFYYSQSDVVSRTMNYGHDQLLSRVQLEPHATGSYSSPAVEDFLVEHIEWKSQRRVGFVKFTNEYGEMEDTIVSEDFPIPDSATSRTEIKDFGRKCTYYDWTEGDTTFSLEWAWIPEVWEGVRINRNMYCRIGPKEEQFRSIDNPYEVKLGYHGLVYNAMNAPSIALMDRMKPFQYLYFIVMHKLKRLIAQDQGKVFHFDISMIDPKLGLEKTLYYLKEMNIDFYNPLMNADQPGQMQRGKISSSTDLSNTQHILNYISLLSAIDQQISEVAGVTRQREGQISPNEAVTNAQANTQMSAVITEIYFHSHDRLWEKILTSLLQCTRTAWKNKSVVKQYVLDDLSLATLEVSSDELSDVDLGVFVTNTGQEVQMFDSLRSIADGLLNTNRATFSDLISLYMSTSAEELKDLVRQSEEQAHQREAQMQQQQMEAQAQMQQQQQQYEMEKQQREFEHDILIHEIDSFKFQKDQDANNNQIPDQLELAKLSLDAQHKAKKLQLEERALDIKEKEIKSRPKPTSKSK